MMLPHDKFIDRWAKIFLHNLYSGGAQNAEAWATRALNQRDFGRVRDRIAELTHGLPKGSA